MNPFPLIGALLVLAAALVVAGVALLAGLAWALIAAGACSALLAMNLTWNLLRFTSGRSSDGAPDA